MKQEASAMKSFGSYMYVSRACKLLIKRLNIGLLIRIDKT